ncbi:MAG TPA: helix-turn-helix transcriptional regulator [Acidimicrobiia bacterium]|nr:helix-turn-helix transcriptional regulator [Acidimicrobiia bacterium]
MEFGRTLRYCRLRAGLTQRQLAVRARVPQPAIARIESGRVVPRADTFSRLLAACGFRLDLQPAGGVDPTAIRELLRLTPSERLALAAKEANSLAGLLGA